MQRIGFKEWAVICEALVRGRQSIILRKGGIAEGRAGFSFQHDAFFLFPTWFHEQSDRVRVHDLAVPEERRDEIEIRGFARVEWSRMIDSWPMVEALEPWHIWRKEVVRERFQYEDAPGVHIAFVRVFRLTPEWVLPNEKRFGGCRSWVDLPAPPEGMQLEPVLSDAEHAAREREVREVLQSD